VRALTRDGQWVGGYAGTGSFYSTYPEPRELFVEQAWELDEDGAFVEVVQGTAGMWIKCDDAPVVQFLVDTELGEQEETDDDQKPEHRRLDVPSEAVTSPARTPRPTSRRRSRRR
jgi:hypothetical protein